MAGQPLQSRTSRSKSQVQFYSEWVHRSSGGCGVAQLGYSLRRLQRRSEGCSVAQTVVRRPAVRQARVRISARHLREVAPTEPAL
jgi:hypothetical protein